MTVARHDTHGSLPPLARHLSNHGHRTLCWMGVVGVVLAVAGAAVAIAAAEGLVAGEVLGWPLVAIGERGPVNFFGWEAPVGDEPRGWVAIGRRPVGFFAFGYQPTGVIAVGNFPVGVLSLGWVAVGIVPFGISALGLVSVGIASGGWLSFGLGCVGWYAYGNSPLGAYAWGEERAYGVYLASGTQGRSATLEKLLFAKRRRTPTNVESAAEAAGHGPGKQ